MNPRPPRLASRFVRFVCPPRNREEIEGDLRESFSRWSEQRGATSAGLRYWREVALLGIWRIRRGRGTLGPEVPRKNPLNQRPSSDLLMDVRFCLRRLAKNPLSSAVAVLLLAIGIGGNTTVFTVVDQLLVEPPPLVQAPEELVGLGWTMPGQAAVEFGYYDYEFYRDRGDAFQDVLAYGGFPGSRGRNTAGGGGEVVIGQGDALEQAGAWVVSGNYFRVLGVRMTHGAGFGAGVQAEQENIQEVVLSHDFWTRNLGADPSVVDRTLFVNGSPFRVVGVTPEEFRGINLGEPLPDLFVPILSAEALSLGFNQQLRRYQEDGSPSASRFLRLVARMNPGFDFASAQAQATILQSQWAEEFTDWAEEIYGSIYQLQLRAEFQRSPFESRTLKRQLYFLWFVVGAVFLIGCANLAILLLATASGREREMGIRSSLGASRRRILGQLITESLVLSGLGALAGMGVTYLGTDLITATLSMTFEGRFSPDISVLAFALLLSTLAAVLFGTAPAWTLSRADVASLVQRPGQDRTRARFRGGLVVAQTSLSVLLLIGGALLARSVQAIQQIDLGWDPDRRLIMGVQLDNGGYSEEEGLTFVAAALGRLNRVPGVRSATVCNRVPFLGSNTLAFTAPGTDFAEQGLRTGLNLVGPRYLEALDISLKAGRSFTRDDGSGSPIVAVVNETFASRMWPEEDPLGRTLDFFGQSVEVVGVAETVVYYNVTEQPRPHVYIPSLQFYTGMQNFIIATDPPSETLVPQLDAALREFDSKLAIAPMTMASLVDEQISPFRIWTVLIVVFAGIALFLALVGLYGVQSFLVSRRAKEIGIRIALGAEAGVVVREVVKSGLIMAGLGALIGLVSALALSGVMRGLLFGVSPNDPLTLTAVPILLVLCCLAASLVPALRASSVNPVEVLAED